MLSESCSESRLVVSWWFDGWLVGGQSVGGQNDRSVKKKLMGWWSVVGDWLVGGKTVNGLVIIVSVVCRLVERQ